MKPVEESEMISRHLIGQIPAGKVKKNVKTSGSWHLPPDIREERFLPMSDIRLLSHRGNISWTLLLLALH